MGFEDDFAILCTSFIEFFHDHVLRVIPSFIEGNQVRRMFLKVGWPGANAFESKKNWLYGPEILSLSGWFEM